MEKIPLEGEARLLRWRDGKLEARKMEINRPQIRPGKLTFIDLMHLELDGDVKGIGWSEPVIDGGRMIGLMSEQTGNGGLLIPGPFIQRILTARKNGDYPGLGFFNFYWQRAENPATLKSLKLDSTDQGVIVIKSIAKMNEESVLKPKDVILEIAGYEIGPEGDYQDPIYGRIMLEALASQKVWAGDEVPMKIWRDGELMDIKYKLPRANYRDEMIPDQNFDEPPQYLIAGGFVFQPLNLPYLKSWGGDWQRSAPFQLAYLKQSIPEDEREAIVILSMVLPDPFNVGYQSTRNLIVHEVNGTKIIHLTDVEEALKHPKDGYHIIQFSEGNSPVRIILDAEQMDRATRRIIRQYGIEEDRHINPVEK
jgi:Zn/Cd-binding protein ZinT